MDEVRQEISEAQKDKHSDNITKWLGASDVSTNWHKAIETRHPRSGQALLEHETFTAWKNQQSSFLWLHGIPGCGKTILASTVIETLKANEECSQALLYFYFDFADIKKQSFENILRSLTNQLYCQNKDIHIQYLDPLYSACHDGQDQPNIASLCKAFESMIQEAGKVWIVLDALDECTSREELLPWIRELLRNAETRKTIHLLATSRPEQDIREAIDDYNFSKGQITIDDDLLKMDIRNYVKASVREHNGLRRWREYPDIQEEIEATLLEKANGM